MRIRMLWILYDCFVRHICAWHITLPIHIPLSCALTSPCGEHSLTALSDRTVQSVNTKIAIVQPRSVHRHVARAAAMGFIGAVAVKLRPAGIATGRAHLLRPFLVTLLQPLVRATEARSTSSDYVRVFDSIPPSGPMPRICEEFPCMVLQTTRPRENYIR